MESKKLGYPILPKNVSNLHY